MSNRSYQITIPKEIIQVKQHYQNLLLVPRETHYSSVDKILGSSISQNKETQLAKSLDNGRKNKETLFQGTSKQLSESYHSGRHAKMHFILTEHHNVNYKERYYSILLQQL